MLPALLMLLDWAAGEAATAVDGKGINLSALDTMPLYRATANQVRYTVEDNQPRYKVIE